MSLRPVTLLFFVISAFWLSVAVPVQAAAETFLVVINAGNRVSGSDAELREVVRQLYLKEESRWPDDLPSLPIARPPKNPATSAFTEAVLGVSPEDLETHWAEAGSKPPGAIGPVRDLLRQISRNKGAFSVIAAAEAKKLPAKVRVLFEFTKGAPVGDAIASFDGTWVLEVRESDQPLSAAERQIVQIVDNKLKAEVSPGTWSGTIDGEIDIAGQLVGYALLSQLISRHSKDKIFKISATFTNGAFKTTAIGIGTNTYFYSIEIKLTPQQLITAVPPPGGTATKEPETVALSPSTEPTPGRPGSFDGQWELVFQQIEGATGGTGSEGIVVETSVVNDRFSVRFTSSSWQGQVSGNIDESGTLVGNGWAVSRKRITPQKFDFEAGYSAGAFQADIEFVPTWGVRVICRVTLTRAS